MKLPSMLAGLVLTMFSVMSASAADPMRFALCYDLTKAYTFVTPQVAQAARDYADLLNLKGGIEGHPVEMIVQDHGNEPQRGIECYEKMKREGVMVFDMLSTPVSRAVLPRFMKDGNIMIQSLAGRGDAVDGDAVQADEVGLCLRLFGRRHAGNDHRHREQAQKHAHESSLRDRRSLRNLRTFPHRLHRRC